MAHTIATFSVPVWRSYVLCQFFFSYVYIFQPVLRMPAAEGGAKACLPHLAVVTLLVANGAFAYLKPVSDSTSTLDLLLSVLYTARLLSPRSPDHWLYAALFPVLTTNQHEQTTRRSAASPNLDRPGDSKAIHRFSVKINNTIMMMEFLLLGFSEVRELQQVQAALFLLVFLAVLMGNLLITAVTALDQSLHTPMYFFLRNVSVLDLCLISVTTPKSIHDTVINGRAVSLGGCVAQVFFVISFAFSELSFLTAMSYDHYADICLPLRYEVIMDRGACGKMEAASWLSGGLFGAMITAETLTLSFSGSNLIQQFFCDVPSLLKISCSETHVVIYVGVATEFILAFISFILIIISYMLIFQAVLRIPAAEGRAKAFSTCLPHLVVVSLFVVNGTFAYLKPVSDSLSALDLLVSVFYKVVPPALNPLIYSLSNQDMKTTLRRMIVGKCL
ncbi:olfactory receptor 14A16-like [Tachyglossus aculeatus]|uniref:olfactory receptor 14A16-like n=1 Tax=Tachyglossus aculeatus TaxID=9261 RepID=UPI0018F37DBE|nr:olfactory receptor 14A16-like [Tachyglossus aculeatus]